MPAKAYWEERREYFVKNLLIRKNLIECFVINIERRIKLQGKIENFRYYVCEEKVIFVYGLFCLILS